MAFVAGEGARVSWGVTAAELDRLPICQPSLVCPAQVDVDPDERGRGVADEAGPAVGPVAETAAGGVGVIQDRLTFGPALVLQSRLNRSFRLDTLGTSAAGASVVGVEAGGEADAEEDDEPK